MIIPTYKFAITEEVIKACQEIDLNPEDFVPKKSDPDATGWDVRCALPNGLELHACSYYKIPLGFRAFCPKGWWAELKPRSSSFTKRHCHVLYGTIDETFEREWLFACQYIPDGCDLLHKNNPARIEFGDRIGQIIPVKRQEMNVEIISNQDIENEYKDRNAVRSGGFGSTGNK